MSKKVHGIVFAKNSTGVNRKLLNKKVVLKNLRSLIKIYLEVIIYENFLLNLKYPDNQYNSFYLIQKFWELVFKMYIIEHDKKNLYWTLDNFVYNIV